MAFDDQKVMAKASHAHKKVHKVHRKAFLLVIATSTIEGIYMGSKTFMVLMEGVNEGPKSLKCDWSFLEVWNF